MLEYIELLKYLWALVLIPIAFWIKHTLTRWVKRTERTNAAIDKAIASLTKDEIELIVEKKLTSIIAKQSELENDFKLVNKEFSKFVVSFYDKINDVTLKLMDK